MTVKDDTTPEMAAPKGPQHPPSEERCFRQVHPQFFQKGRLTEMAFRLKDHEYGLSISLSSKTSVDDAFALYTKPKEQGGKGLAACGTWAVTTDECHRETCAVYEDPTDIDAAHGSIDMRHLKADKDRRKTVQTNLRIYAQERGCIHGPAKEEGE